MVKILEEDILSLTEAAKVIPRIAGKRPHTSSLWRWARLGLRTTSGRRVSLEYVRLGRRIVTSREALERFAQALTDADTQRASRQVPIARHPGRGRSAKRREPNVQPTEVVSRRAGI